MSTYRLFKLAPDDVTQAELLDSSDKEKQIARSVFRRWPVATCLPTTVTSGVDAGAVILTIWETADDAKNRRTPVAVVRTPNEPKRGFKKELWTTPVSA